MNMFLIYSHIKCIHVSDFFENDTFSFYQLIPFYVYTSIVFIFFFKLDPITFSKLMSRYSVTREIKKRNKCLKRTV